MWAWHPRTPFESAKATFDSIVRHIGHDRCGELGFTSLLRSDTLARPRADITIVG
jgi:hypothetical protein